MEVNIIPKFLDEALSPVAKEAGETLSDLINLARSPLIKARKVRDIKFEYFLQNLEKELKSIPEDNVTEPPLSVVGPALEDLFKYYMEEEHIVEAFKKLISNSMDIDKQEKVLPSYFGVIKQMTQFDAFTYQLLINNKKQEVFTGFISIADINTGGKLRYHIAFWDSPPQKESELEFDWENRNNTWNLEDAQKSINSLHTLKILGLVDTKKTLFKKTLFDYSNQHDPNMSGYLNSRFQNIIDRYIGEYNLEFYLYRERVILYFLTDYGKALGKLLK